jgi:hypothetical protein
MNEMYMTNQQVTFSLLQGDRLNSILINLIESNGMEYKTIPTKAGVQFFQLLISEQDFNLLVLIKKDLYFCCKDTSKDVITIVSKEELESYNFSGVM